MPKSTTALHEIIKFIEARKLCEMVQWSKRKRYLKDGQLMRYIRQLNKKIRLIMNLLSGYDIIEMLKGENSHLV